MDYANESVETDQICNTHDATSPAIVLALHNGEYDLADHAPVDVVSLDEGRLGVVGFETGLASHYLLHSFEQCIQPDRFFRGRVGVQFDAFVFVA